MNWWNEISKVCDLNDDAIIRNRNRNMKEMSAKEVMEKKIEELETSRNRVMEWHKQDKEILESILNMFKRFKEYRLVQRTDLPNIIEELLRGTTEKSENKDRQILFRLTGGTVYQMKLAELIHSKLKHIAPSDTKSIAIVTQYFNEDTGALKNWLNVALPFNDFTTMRLIHEGPNAEGSIMVESVDFINY